MTQLICIHSVVMMCTLEDLLVAVIVPPFKTGFKAVPYWS